MGKKKILLTGITGYLGSHLARALVDYGYEVFALTRSSSNLHRISDLITKIHLVEINQLDFNCFFQDVGKIHIVIHSATCYGRKNEPVSEVFACNVDLPLKLLDASHQAGVEVFLNVDTSLEEEINVYSFSKKQFLRWGKFLSKKNTTKFVNARLEHFYGEFDDDSKFSSKIIRACLNNAPKLDLTAGEQKRDFIYINDVITALCLIVNNEYNSECNFEEFEIGSGESVSIKEFVHLVKSITKSDIYLNFGEIPYREGDLDMNLKANITKLVKLGWSQSYNLKLGLEKVINIEKGE